MERYICLDGVSSRLSSKDSWFESVLLHSGFDVSNFTSFPSILLLHVALAAVPRLCHGGFATECVTLRGPALSRDQAECAS
jgi:hypothetical protein